MVIVRRLSEMFVGPRYQACPRALVRRHNRCAAGPTKHPILVLAARYPRLDPGLACSTPGKSVEGASLADRAAAEAEASRQRLRENQA